MPDPIKPPEATPPVDPLQGLSDHDKAMVAKAEGLPGGTAPPAPTEPPAGTPPAPAARPEHVPEKFWDAAKGEVRMDALLKSYSELEKARPADPPKAPEGTPPVEPPAAPAGKPDFAKMAAEVEATGTVSEDSLKALETIGFGKDLAEQFIAGQQALAAQRDAVGFQAVGGEEAYKAMLGWAATSWTPEQQQAFNAAVGPRSPQATMLMAVQSLKASYEAANGRAPALVQGGNAGAGQGAFASAGEMTAAMRDPRYRTDSAYRAEVERRVGLMP